MVQMADEYALGPIRQDTGEVIPLFFVSAEPLGDGKAVMSASTNADFIEYHKAQGDEDEAMESAAHLLISISDAFKYYAQLMLEQEEKK